MTPATLAETLRPLLTKVAKGKVKQSALLTVAGDDATLLARALWHIVAEGDGALVAKDRRFIDKLVPYKSHLKVSAGDFLSLLRALAKARPGWLTGRPSKSYEAGLVYAGWCIELERIMDRVQDAGSLIGKQSPPLPEPVASSLSFALARRGLPATLPKGALERFATAFAKGYSPDGKREQFAGFKRVWSEETWAKAVWQACLRVKELGVWFDDLAPLVRYASEEQLVAAATKLNDMEDEVTHWLYSRSDAIIPWLEGCVRKALWVVQRGSRPFNDQLFPIGVLARIRREKGLPWPEAWMSLAMCMVERGSKAVRDVLAAIEPETREQMLLKRLEGPISWDLEIDPVAWFPTDRLVKAVKAKVKEGKSRRNEYLDVLAKMGERGQEALLELARGRDLDLRSDALHRLTSTAAAAQLIADMLLSKSSTFAEDAYYLLMKLDDEPFFGLLGEGKIPPGIAARLLAARHYHPRTPVFAEALPDSEETRPFRAFCLFRPAPLTALSEAMYAVDEAALKKARKAFAPVFKETFPSDKKCAAALRPMHLADFPAVLRESVRQVRYQRTVVESLAKHFAARPEIAWAAVMWLSYGEEEALAAIDRALGAAVAAPLRARLELGMIEPKAKRTALEILAEHDPVGAWQSFADNAADEAVRPAVVAGICAALQAAEDAAGGVGEAPVRRWLVASLDGSDESARDVALEVFARKPDAGLMPALERLRTAPLPPATRRRLETALATPQASGAPRERSSRALTTTLLHKVKGPIRSLFISRKGTVLAAHAGGTIHLWRGEREARISDLGGYDVRLSLGGRYVLIMQEFDLQVYDALEPDAPPNELSPSDGFFDMEPLPGGYVVTMSASNNSGTSLYCHRLDDGDGGGEHSERISYPSAVAPLSGGRYVVGGGAGDVAVLDIKSGKLLVQLRDEKAAQARYSSQVESVCAGAGQVAALCEDGSLRFWALDGNKAELLAEHVERAPDAQLAADRRSTWAATLHADRVQPWKSGQPARALTAERRKRKSIYDDRDERSLVFVRRGVLAVGGAGVDLWDLEAGEHLGRLAQPVTALCAQGGKLYAGDSKGRIFRVEAPKSP